MENEKAEGNVYDGEEERKVEEFFSLIRRFHEARNRRKGEIMDEKESSSKKKIRRLDDEGGKSSWVPSFSWEDFTAEIEFREPPLICPAGPGPKCDKRLKDEKKKQVVKEDHGLDLNLTL